MTLKFSAVAAAIILLTACASTAGNTSGTEATVYTGFTERTDGSALHQLTGMTCPARLGEMQLVRSDLIQDDGSDVFCNWQDETGLVSLFLSNFDDLDLGEYFALSLRDTGTVMDQTGFTRQAELEDVCDAKGLDTNGLLQGVMSGQSDISLRVWPTAVWQDDTRLSVMALEEVEPGLFMKFRYTFEGQGKADTEKACAFLYDNYKNRRDEILAKINPDRFKGEALRRFIDAAAES